MIREKIESAYKKTIGVPKETLVGYTSSLTRGGGLIKAPYLILLVALMAGFINAFVFPVSNQSYIVYPAAGAMTIPEAIIDAFIIMVGGAGVYLVYQSGRQTVRARTVNLYLGLALLLLVVAVFVGIDMAILKGFG
jgi:predicted ABC-type sugar transport system permease subunit